MHVINTVLNDKVQNSIKEHYCTITTKYLTQNLYKTLNCTQKNYACETCVTIPILL